MPTFHWRVANACCAMYRSTSSKRANSVQTTALKQTNQDGRRQCQTYSVRMECSCMSKHKPVLQAHACPAQSTARPYGLSAGCANYRGYLHDCGYRANHSAQSFLGLWVGTGPDRGRRPQILFPGVVWKLGKRRGDVIRLPTRADLRVASDRRAAETMRALCTYTARGYNPQSWVWGRITPQRTNAVSWRKNERTNPGLGHRCNQDFILDQFRPGSSS